jgi:tetratricopeptide (TPR) repeat protein
VRCKNAGRAGWRRTGFVTALRLPRAMILGVVLIWDAVGGCGQIARSEADTFVLKAGGQIEGQWLNRHEQPLLRYDILVRQVRLALAVDQVREVRIASLAKQSYPERAAATPDTAAAQWELAEWCRKNGLMAERQVHLRRVLELNPEHAEARRALGYQFLGGRWVTRADVRRDQGYELYRGQWRTAQEIDILEERARQELAEKEWLARLTRWRRDLEQRERKAQAMAALSQVRDPAAARPLGVLFAREPWRAMKLTYADLLVAIDTPVAHEVLLERMLADPDEEVFYGCLDRLVQLRPPQVTARLVEALKDNDNVRVNRAAIALGKLQDRSAISPLIDALRTTHTQVLARPRGGEATAATFTSDGTYFKQGDGPKLLVTHVQNQPVLDALTRLTGVNFGFDQAAWRYWLAQERKAGQASDAAFDARRQTP